MYRHPERATACNQAGAKWRISRITPMRHGRDSSLRSPCFAGSPLFRM